MTPRLPSVPDEPRWIEATAILASAERWIEPAGTGHVIGHAASQLMVAIGDADVAEVVRIATARPGWSLLAAPERDDLRAALEAAGCDVEAVQLFTLPDPDELPDDEGAALLPLPAMADVLAHVPAPLADEIIAASRRGTVWTVAVDGVAACFAYAPWRSARWFDVSVDTLPSYRQLGLATRVAAALIRAERAAGREPVWGAVESNAASLRLAARLGFAAVDALWIARSP